MKNKIKKFNEFIDNSIYDLEKLSVYKLTEEEYEYVASASFDDVNIVRGLNNYFIYMGYNPIFEKPRIKICETSSKKCFIILLDTLEIIGDYDTNVITDDVIDRLKKWIKLNIEIIYKFSTTADFSYDQFEFVLKLNPLR